VRDEHEMLWREDATTQHTDRFRAFVRHEIVPLAKERNPQLLSTLTRTMNLIGDEDDMLDAFAEDLVARYVVRLEPIEEGCVLSPMLAAERLPMLRRVVVKVLEDLLDPDDRVETASVDAVLLAFEGGKPKSGYVTNIQGNLAVSANKQGVRIEPMAAFRTRRNRA
jgi:tRNA(Ile)-lysidine synthase